MKNITLKVDDETYRRARIRAAEAGTSVSAMVRDFLNQIERNENQERIESLKALYQTANERAKGDQQPVKPLTRGEIYDECLR